jgi:uncharacterized protein YbjT (DUF2867 family)
VHLSPALMQPIGSDDVAAFMAEVALSAPLNGPVELAGPERVRLNEIVQRYLAAKHDPRPVAADPHAPYFGVELDDRSLVPGEHPRLGHMRFETWLAWQR